MSRTRRFSRNATGVAPLNLGKRKVISYLTLAVLAISATTAAALGGGGDRTITAYFRSAAGLYTGDPVTVLGVQIRTVTDIDPEPDSARVTLTLTSDQPIPADAGAAIIAPTLVSGRYVQLAPAYTEGPKMPSGASIAVADTATPVEYDELKEQLVALSKDLGPSTGAEGRAQRGALDKFLNASATTLEGNGKLLRESLSQLSKAATTLDKSSPDLFTTVKNLSTITRSLSTSDDQISAFSRQLAQLSGVLDDNRTELDTFLNSINAAFSEVKQFIDNNRTALKDAVGKANTTTQVLVDRVDTLASILHSGPNALSNFYNIYDPAGNSLTGNVAIPDFPDPRSLICALLTTVDAPQSDCVKVTRQLATNLAAADKKSSINKQSTRKSAGESTPEKKSAERTSAPKTSTTPTTSANADPTQEGGR